MTLEHWTTAVLKVTQPDLQREFYRARHNTVQPYCIPSLSVSTATSDLPGIRHALAATRHLLEMYRRQFSDDKTRRRLQRLDRRLEPREGEKAAGHKIQNFVIHADNSASQTDRLRQVARRRGMP